MFGMGFAKCIALRSSDLSSRVNIQCEVQCEIFREELWNAGSFICRPAQQSTESNGPWSPQGEDRNLRITTEYSGSSRPDQVSPTSPVCLHVCTQYTLDLSLPWLQSYKHMKQQLWEQETTNLNIPHKPSPFPTMSQDAGEDNREIKKPYLKYKVLFIYLAWERGREELWYHQHLCIRRYRKLISTKHCLHQEASLEQETGWQISCILYVNCKKVTTVPSLPICQGSTG